MYSGTLRATPSYVLVSIIFLQGLCVLIWGSMTYVNQPFGAELALIRGSIFDESKSTLTYIIFVPRGQGAARGFRWKTQIFGIPGNGRRRRGWGVGKKKPSDDCIYLQRFRIVSFCCRCISDR